ncbi:MAG: hypothetical protein AAGH89_09265 [Verrucomicrobiota bacterium]
MYRLRAKYAIAVLIPLYVMSLWVGSHFHSSSTVAINVLEKCFLLIRTGGGDCTMEISTGAIAELAPSSGYRSIAYRQDGRPTVTETMFGSAPRLQSFSGVTGNIWTIAFPIWLAFLAVTLLSSCYLMRTRRRETALKAE